MSAGNFILALSDDRADRFEQKAPEQPTRTRKLTACSANVDQLKDISARIRIGEQQQQGHHEAVDRHRFDHGQSDKQRA